MGIRGTMLRIELLLFIILLLVGGWGMLSMVGRGGESLHERNTQRRADLAHLREALLLYAMEHDGRLPANIPMEEQALCQVLSPCTDLVDLSVLVPRYIARIPADPFAQGIESAFYTIRRDGKNVILHAPHAEGGVEVWVER